MKQKFVSVFPEVQHRCSGGTVVSVRLRRKAGEYTVECSGCDTRFVYRKPVAGKQRHFRSPLLPEIKGNFDSEDH